MNSSEVPSMTAAAPGAAAFGRLHPAVRGFHALQGCVVMHGRVSILPPVRGPGRWLGALTGTPLQPHEGPFDFQLDAAPREEVWTRFFPGRTMRSRLRLDGRRLVETLGPALLLFVLEESQGRLDMRLQALRLLGVPCPRWLLPQVLAREHGDDGSAGDAAGSRLHFDVSASVPGIGRVARYRGWLDLPPADKAAP